MATKIEGGGSKALVAGPLKKLFCGFPTPIKTHPGGQVGLHVVLVLLETVELQWRNKNGDDMKWQRYEMETKKMEKI